jgi:S-adenosylmethionine:tRNA ribosyltransferase-isomerase
VATLSESTANGEPRPAPSDDELSLAAFDYPLPVDRIAQRPLDERDQSKLLVLDRESGAVRADTVFANIADYLDAGDLLVMNETKVSALRLFGKTETDGRAEFLLTHRVEEGVWHSLVKPGRRLRPGMRVRLGEDLSVEIVESLDERGGRLVRIERFGRTEGTDEILDRIGLTPLPPYIRSDDPNRYRGRYQTIYAANPGSAAAPTAGLHFTDEVFGKLKAKRVDTARVTLHVGVGTFRPIEASNIADHTMHEETGSVPEETALKIRGARGRIVAVGTTTVRTLESASTGPRSVRPGPFKTSMYITPGYRFQTVDAMVTNFHMPRSTLLVLVSAFAGRSAILSAYAKALAGGYRFLSFGDSMLIIGQSSHYE